MTACPQCDRSLNLSGWCSSCRQHVPTPEQIAERCAAEQAKWTPAERERRSRHLEGKPVELPVVAIKALLGSMAVD